MMLKGIILCCTHQYEAEQIQDDFIYKLRIEPMGSKFNGQVRRMVEVTPPAQQAAASSQAQAPVIPRGSVALAPPAPAPQQKARPSGKGQGKGPTPSLANFLDERAKGKGKGKSSAPTGWSWGKKGKPAWTGSAGKGSKSAGSKGPYHDSRSSWRSSDWGGGSQSSNWNSWRNQNW